MTRERLRTSERVAEAFDPLGRLPVVKVTSWLKPLTEPSETTRLAEPPGAYWRTRAGLPWR